MAFMSKQQHLTTDRDEDGVAGDGGSDRSGNGRGQTVARKKDRNMTAGTHWLLQTGLYKRNQGRVIRQVTFGVLLATIAIGCWRISELADRASLKFGLPLAMLAVGFWLSYRIVNFPTFADFLIAVEAEMAKVSWPTRSQLIKSSLVVIITIIGLAAILWVYDTFWRFLLGRFT
jgi:preprotein translocase subunit SecE